MPERRRIDLGLPGDIVVAMVELTIARVRLRSRQPSASTDGPTTTADLSPENRKLIERIRYAIPRVASRLPWRADCLVQALAARRWLGRNGVATDLHFGLPKAMPDAFEAHAWLTAGGLVVTGGDLSNYQMFQRA